MTQPDLLELVQSADREPVTAPLLAAELSIPTRKVAPPRWSRSRLLLAGFLILLVMGGSWGAWSAYRSGRWRGEDSLSHLRKTTVARVDLSAMMTAPGRVESLHNTVISCELERLEIRSAGQSVMSGGASVIIELIPEGSQVKKGDVLCRMDSSEYEELVRTQEMKTEQASAALMQAQLNFEVAELAVKEFRDGLFKQNIQLMEGSLALAKSGLERATDRLQWSEKMLKKGYVSVATKSNDRQTLNECLLDLQISRDDLNNFREFGSVKTQKVLESEVEMRRFEVIANTMRVGRNKERLAYYKDMVEKCTIRAPHDGFLIYAADPTRPGAAPIEEGQTVRQLQKLFFLPDLANMQVFTYLHESIAHMVEPGMRATARIEGLSNRVLEGHVVSIGPLPTTAGNWISDELKYFVAEVKLDSVPNGIRPGMSAEVQFDIDRRLDVLAVPSEAVAVEKGHNICYVAGVDGLERRPVTLGRSTRDLLEVTKGLSEGDQVLMQPDKIEALDSLLVNSGKDAGDEAESASPASAPSGAPVSVE